MSNKQDLGEQALGKAAEAAITSQLDQVEQVDVDVETDPLKAVQGKVDSVAISGEGMVMKQELRVEAIGINTDSVAINPLKAVLGEIELTEATNADVNVLLTEEDLNRALSSAYLSDKMKNLKIEVQGQPHLVDIQKVKVKLLEGGELALDVELLMQESNETKQFTAKAKPLLKDNGYRIDLEIISAEGKGLSLDFMTALFAKIVELLDLHNFDFNGMALQLKDFDVNAGKVMLRGTVRVEQGSIQSS
jgi:hypothetical protein